MAGWLIPGPPPVPGPIPLPVPGPVPDPIPPPVPGPAPPVPLPPDPVPVPVVTAGTGADGAAATAVGAGLTSGTTAGFGGTTGFGGATFAAASGTGVRIVMNCNRSPALLSAPEPELPPPPPAGPGPPAPTVGLPLKFVMAAGHKISAMMSACAKREAAIPLHRPSLLLGTPTGGRRRPFMLPALPPLEFPSATHQ